MLKQIKIKIAMLATILKISGYLLEASKVIMSLSQ